MGATAVREDGGSVDEDLVSRWGVERVVVDQGTVTSGVRTGVVVHTKIRLLKSGVGTEESNCQNSQFSASIVSTCSNKKERRT